MQLFCRQSFHYHEHWIQVITADPIPDHQALSMLLVVLAQTLLDHLGAIGVLFHGYATAPHPTSHTRAPSIIGDHHGYLLRHPEYVYES